MKLGLIMVLLLQSTLALYPSTVWAVSTYPNCDSKTEDKNDKNRTCDLKPDVAKIQTEIQKCKDIVNEEEKKQCLLKNGLENATISKEDSNLESWSKGMQITNQVAQVGWSLMNLAFYEKGTCQTYSWTLMNLAGIASGVGELAAFFFVHMPKTKELHEKYKDLASNADNSTAQRDAFSYLKEEQEIKAQTDQTRAIVYGISTALYASAVVAAITEIMASKAAPALASQEAFCKSGKGVSTAFFNGPLFKLLGVASGLLPIAKSFYNTESVKEKNHVMNLLKKEIFWLRDLMEAPLEHSIVQSDIERSWWEISGQSTSIVEYSLNKKIDVAEKKEIKSLFSKLINELSIGNAYAEVGSPVNLSGGQTNMWSSPNTGTPPVNPNTAVTQYNVNTVGCDVPGGGQVEINTKAGENLTSQASTKKSTFQKSAERRLIGASVMTVLGGTVMTFAIYQSKEHNRRAGEYQALIDKLPKDDSVLGLCKIEDRKDPSKPNCYCYIEEQGAEKPNPSTANTDICKQKFGLTKNIDYDSKTTVANGKVCFNKNGTMDMTCKCKQEKDKGGTGNSCMKVQKGFDVKSNLGFTGMGNSALNAFNKLAEGDIRGASLSGSSISNTMKAAENLKRKLNEALKKNGLPPISDQEQREALGAVLKSAEDLIAQNGLGSGSGSSNLMASIDPKLAEKMDKKALASGVVASDLKFTGTSAVAGAKKEGFDMGDLGGSDSGSGEVVDIGTDEVMAKNFNYGGNDISKNSGENIFKMISNRYLVSGLKRLFEEEKPVEAPEAIKPETKPATP
ncbi:MAG: hypothetical protein ACOYL6_10035 [Bacteriovoracaceae bacterium]